MNWEFARLIATAGVVFGLDAAVPAMAQQTGERVLSRASVSENGRCAIVDIRFNYPLRLISNFPAESGNQILIRLRPADGVVDALTRRETLPAPRSAAAGIRDIEYEGNVPGGPTLTIVFLQPVFFRIGQSPDFQNLTLAVSRNTPDPNCIPQLQARPPAAPPPQQSDDVLPPVPPDTLLDQARMAITNKDYETAIRLLTKLLMQPDNPSAADAQELLGVARERNGQMAHAKAEYEEYLRRYPMGDGADRVRQRLATLLRNAMMVPKTGPGGGLGFSKAPALASQDSQSRWFLNGSVSEYFYHDQMKTVVNDDITHVVIDNGYTTLQSQLVSALDANLGYETEGFQAKLRVAAAQTKDFLSGRNDNTLVSQFFFEGSNSSRTILGRVGRQYRTVGGLLGRFDGFLLSYQPFEHFRADIIGGFPVDSSRSSFSTQRKAYGASFAYINGPWNADIYAMRQTDHGILDREPIGVETRYVSGQSSFLGLFEYDMHFAQINAALANGTASLGPKTVLNVALDYRRAPLLRTSNALIGQPVGSLDDLLSTYTMHEIEQLALDRAAKSASAFVSLTQTFDDRFSAGLDATLWHLSGTPESGGVPIMPSMGTEYYFAAHFIGTNLLTEGDMAAATLGYARSYNANRYTFDLNARFPLMRELRIGPRFFTSYRQTSDVSSTTRYTFRPTIRLNYRPRSYIELEFEGGAEWEHDIIGSTTIQTWNFVSNLGVRVDF